jgi:hypothetical protein
LTRYRLRQLLADSLGSILVDLGASSLAPIEHQVAHGIWRDGGSVQAVGARLRLTVAEVQAIRKRLIGRLLGALRGKPKREAIIMNSQEASNLLKRALTSPEQHSVLNQVKQHRQAILDAMEEKDIELSESERTALAKHPQWVARVYEALGDVEELSEKEKAIDQAVQEIFAHEEREIGRAFAQLLDNLHPRFGDWDDWFGAVPQVAEEYQAELLALPVLEHGGDLAKGLVKYGMSPGTIYSAARGIELLSNRLLRWATGIDPFEPSQEVVAGFVRWLTERHESGDFPAVVIAFNPDEIDQPAMPLGLVLAEIKGTPNCQPEAAQPLLDWMLEVATLRPFFFSGYEAKPVGEKALQLVQLTSKDKEGVYIRWQKEAEELVYA